MPLAGGRRRGIITVSISGRRVPRKILQPLEKGKFAGERGEGKSGKTPPCVVPALHQEERVKRSLGEECPKLHTEVLGCPCGGYQRRKDMPTSESREKGGGRKRIGKSMGTDLQHRNQSNELKLMKKSH